MAGDFKDLRYLFMRGLIEHEKSQRSRHYLKSAAECTSRAVVSLELSPNPITNVKQAKKLEGIGGETCARLSKLDEERNFSSLKPIHGRFVSSAGAILVTLLHLTDEKAILGNNKNKDILIPEEEVKAQSRLLCEEHFIEPNNEGFCVAWWRLEVLIKRGYIKRRSQKKKSVLQLLPTGQVIAQRLEGNNGQKNNPSTVPWSKDKIQHGQNLPNENNTSTSCTEAVVNDLFERESVYKKDPGNDRIILLVDTQEMGGERAGLGELCRLLEQSGVSYRTKKLSTGDYSWIWRCGDVEITLPCLVERKRADDIPCTLKEGRFWSQINKMLDWKRGFTDRNIDCNLHYILERKPEEYVVKCTDGCMGIGQCGNPTLSQIKMVIEDLKHHPELLVKETDSLEITVLLLKSLTNELEQRALKGDFDALIQQPTQPNPSVKKEIETGQSIVMPETDLSFDEQLKLALENSLIDIGPKPKSEETGITKNDDLVLFDRNCIRGIGRKVQAKIEQPKSQHLVAMIEDPISDTPLMQYHCTMGSSVTCQLSDNESKFDDYKNEYRPKINRKRTHDISPEGVDGFCAESSKKTRVTTFLEVDTNNTDIINQCQEKSGDKQDHKDPISKLDKIKTEQSNVCRTKLDKTDEILDSLKQSSVVRPPCEKEFNQPKDYCEEKEYKPKVRLKPIKMSLSPSKLFIETNIVKVKEELLSPWKYGQKKSIKVESMCSKLSLQDKDLAANRTEQMKKSEIHTTEIYSPSSREIFADGDTNTSPIVRNPQTTDMDNTSLKSIEDIFADTSSQENDALQNDISDEVYDKSTRKVYKWLLNDCASIYNSDSSAVKESPHSVSDSSGEDSNNSLPDLNFKPDTVICPDDNDHTEIDINEGDIVITDEDEVSRPGPSNSNSKTERQKSRKAHDSGYESEDFRGIHLEGAASKNISSLSAERASFRAENVTFSADSELESQIDSVTDILPHTSRNRVRTALKACGYSVEQCISFLLDQSELYIVESNLGESIIDLTD